MKNALFSIIIVLFFSNSYSQEYSLFFNTYADTTYINQLISKADAASVDSASDRLADSAIYWYNQAALLSKRWGYISGIVYAYVELSRFQFGKRNYIAGLQAANNALPFLGQLEKPYQFLIPQTFNLKGNNLYKIGFYDSAIHNYQLALSAIAWFQIDSPLQSSIFNNIASVFITLEQLPTGLSYYHKALKIPGVDSLGLANTFMNLGTTYSNLVDDMDSATYWWSKAAFIYRDQKRKDELQYLYANMSICWQSPKHEDLAKSARYLDSAIQAAPSNAYHHNWVLQAAAYIAYSKGDYEEAINFCHRLITQCRSNDKPTLTQAYWLLSYCYALVGDKDQMKIYQAKQSKVNESLNNRQALRSINVLNIKYQVSEKERALAESKTQTLRQRNWLILSGGGILFITFLSIGYIRSVRQRRRLDAQKITTLEQQNQIRTLDIRMEAEEQERIRISGELHDSLGVWISAAKLNNTLLRKNIHSDPQRMQDICTDGAAILDNIHREMRTIAHNLKPEYYLSDKGLGDALKQLIHKLQSKSLQIFVSEFGPGSKLHPQRSFTAYRILEEIINNSLRHARASKLDIQLVYTESHLNISAEDDGIGFNEASVTKGIGLNNIRRRIEQLNGHLTLNVEEGLGTAYLIEIPY